jgi:hypothetical protein
MNLADKMAYQAELSLAAKHVSYGVHEQGNFLGSKEQWV